MRERLSGLARYGLPVLVVLLCAGAWYSDVILEIFAHRPKAAHISGSWRLDEEEYRRMAEQVANSVPEGPSRDKYRAALLTAADPFRGAIYTFTAEGYSIRDANGEREFPATYEGFPPNSLAIRPANGKPMAVILPEGSKYIIVNFPMVGMPLVKVE